MNFFFVIFLAFASLSWCVYGDEWSELAPIPDSQGFAGMFAGISQETLLVAGGANFPDKKPWEGGTKVWYNQIFAFDLETGAWQKVGQLPRPLAYGVSVTHRNSIVCIGGSNSDGHYADVFRLSLAKHAAGDKTIQYEPLPSLPITIANACGALVGDVLYVAGGQESPDALTALAQAFRIDLSSRDPQWQSIDPIPGGPRMLSVAASLKGDFWLVGGVALTSDQTNSPSALRREYKNEAYRYRDGSGWKRLPDMPRAVTAAPSPAPVDESNIYLLGGDDGTQVGVAPEKHRGFSTQILRFDIERNTWHESGTVPASRVTVPCVLWRSSVLGRHAWVIPSGEKKPGVRSPSVWLTTIGSKE